MKHKSHNFRVLRSLSPGDRVEFHRGLYSHWGIYIEYQNIIHVTGDKDNKVVIRIDNFWDVVGEDKASKNNGKDQEWRTLSVDEIIDRARSYLGKTDYNLLLENCEHFVNWCRYDRKESDQAANILVNVARCGGIRAVDVAHGAAVIAQKIKVLNRFSSSALRICKSPSSFAVPISVGGHGSLSNLINKLMDQMGVLASKALPISLKISKHFYHGNMSPSVKCLCVINEAKMQVLVYL